jgi:hypothetical protein
VNVLDAGEAGRDRALGACIDRVTGAEHGHRHVGLLCGSCGLGEFLLQIARPRRHFGEARRPWINDAAAHESNRGGDGSEAAVMKLGVNPWSANFFTSALPASARRPRPPKFTI